VGMGEAKRGCGWSSRAVERVSGRHGRCLAGEGRAAASFKRVYASFV
jgi:hypothetical protein